MADTVETVIRNQRRKRRLSFWAGFVVLAGLGSVWAGLGTRPLQPFDDGFGGPFIEDIFIDEAFPVPVGIPQAVPAPPIPIPPPVPIAPPPLAPTPAPLPEPDDG